MMKETETRIDAVAHAIADPTRRRIVAHLRSDAGATTAQLAGLAPALSRFAVMKHIAVLRDAGLVRTMSDGRRRRHYLEPAALVPLREWLSR